jgi:hypothetical protein
MFALLPPRIVVELPNTRSALPAEPVIEPPTVGARSGLCRR